MKPDSLYRTPAGKRYHRPYCPTLEGARYLEVTRAGTIRLRLAPCLVCHPPTCPPLVVCRAG